MNKYITVTLLLAIILITSAYRFRTNIGKTNIYGYWVREKDNLQMELSPTIKDYSVGLSHIRVVGNSEFPCDLKKKIIYKNIVQQKDSVWSCDFLVVSTDDCSLNYKDDGKIILTKIGQLLIVCPGFQPMYYDKKNPRHTR